MKYFLYPYQQAPVNGLYLIANSIEEANILAMAKGYAVGVDCGLTTEEPKNYRFTFSQLQKLTNNFTK